jgi:hypothetical protein
VNITPVVLFFAERNLNPKAACLKRREEEKAEDGPKIPQHHLLQQAPYPALPVSSHVMPSILPKNFDN